MKTPVGRLLECVTLGVGMFRARAARSPVSKTRPGAPGVSLVVLALFPAVCAVTAHGQVSEAASAIPNPIGVSAAPVPIAIVPVSAATTVTGALQVTAGKAMIATAGSITSDHDTTEVTLPRRGVLRVCAGTTIKLTSDTSVPAGETPGLMMALDHGAIEASFATGRNSDILLTPDFRILIGGPGAADVKVRLGQHGDTCVDNPGANAPYVLVTSVFDGGAYRVQAGQRVMFQHGSLREVVDQEKEPCGCPAAARPGTNDFPLDQSAGLTPLPMPAPSAPAKAAPQQGSPEVAKTDQALVYQAPKPAEAPAQSASPSADPKVAQPSPVPAPAKQNKPGFFKRIGGFFRKLFGAN